MADFDTMNKEYMKYFPDGIYPARTCVAVSALPR
jgi:enamine deaminase RidA (YjgF/YER057c/UK114 family)